MFKKIIFAFLLSVLYLSNVAYATESDLTYTKLTSVDLNTFNEYRFKITEQYLELRNHFEIYKKIDVGIANKLLNLSETGYKYLPDNLLNKNIYTKLKTAISKWIQFPENDSNYTTISTQILSFLEDVDIDKINWKIDAYPSTWNAPLNVTFRWNVVDPSWTKIPTYNYTWWMDEWWKRKVLSNSKWSTLNYTFKEEWTFTVFLDVTSNHKNVNWYTDVLPFRSRSDVKINEKVASLIIKVGSSSLRDNNELKFTPEEASYWLVFDATSSTPTWWSTFSKTKWDFWNGIIEENNWWPKVRRIVYSREWDYTVILKLTTNEWKSVERKFVIIVHDPIATINTNLEEWYLGDKFTFSAQSWTNDDNFTYSWEIVNIANDSVIFRKSWKLFTYSFTEKWQYNVILKVNEPSNNTPDIDTKIIYINSKAPVATFVSSTPLLSRPNYVLLDATKSYDPDFSDEWKLKFSWIIDWERLELESPNSNGSMWYYSFDSIWEHSVVLEVEDPDWIIIQNNQKVNVKSILSVDFAILPRVATREQTILFEADSSEAKVFEWDFWDAIKVWWKDSIIKHKYEKSWIFKVKLKVIDKDDNTNFFTRDVYIWDSNYPYAFIDIKASWTSNVSYKEWVCDGQWAYIVNRVDPVTISWDESINITWENKGLTYSWKLNDDKYYTTSTFTKKFDELWCFPVKLVIKSDNNWKTDTKTTWVKVENLKPTLSSVDVTIQDDTIDPVVVNVSAVWVKDLDWVIQSYLWYYYTDVDSEPQDFRATRLPNTNFVLPKVTWNYYFVVIMKDNNEARVSSEEVTGSKYFVTLTWDNINTPLVNLIVNKSSVSIWDEVVFTAKVENILWQDITKRIEFSWDLDWDWFYEKWNNTSVVQYSFINSWEFHTKVKAKYKWFSNTKSVTIWVSNVLKPDFSYISVGSKFVFLDKSIWENNIMEWDLWDGTIISNKKYFTHEYKDNKTSHDVKLTLKEWEKSKFLEQKVVKNIKNYLKARKWGLVVFTNPDIIKDEINLESKQPVYVYLGESKGDIKNYVIDEDLGNDSDLNWWKDDDEDNKTDLSYTDWSPILIKLNASKVQKVRVLTKDSSGKTIDSYDFVINKSYIDEQVDISTLDFTWVTDSEKLKIEKLKDYINTLPDEFKLKAVMYVQKLQEEWFDNREKTNVILEFEGFINEIPEGNSEEIINVLESLLVEWQEDQSETSITFNALKNLLPLNIKCPSDVVTTKTTSTWATTEEWQASKCYLSLIEKLELIRDGTDIEKNKALGVEILTVIEKDELMDNNQKIDFKAILKTLVYWWINNIPAEEILKTENTDSGSKDVLWLIWTILFWFAMIICGFIWIALLYYVYYLLVNKDKNIWFQDFIIDKTSWGKKDSSEDKLIPVDDFKDILWDLNDEKVSDKQDIIWKIEKDKVDDISDTEFEDFKDDSVKDIDTKKETKNKTEVFNFSEVKKDKEDTTKKDSKVPDWLTWSFWSEESEEKEDFKLDLNNEVEVKQEDKVEKEEVKVEEKSVVWDTTNQDSKIPDWLKWSFWSDDKKDEVIKEDVKEDILADESINKKDINKEEKLVQKTEEKPSEDNIPDWLKWSFWSDNKKDEIILEEKNTSPQPSPLQEKELEKIKEDKEEVIPEVKKEKKKEVAKKEKVKDKNKKEEFKHDSKLPTNEELEEITKIDDANIGSTSNIPDWLKSSFWTDDKKEEVKTEKTKESKVKVEEEKIKKVEKPEGKLDAGKKEEKITNWDLWDDWMKIPDWLKTDDK